MAGLPEVEGAVAAGDHGHDDRRDQRQQAQGEQREVEVVRAPTCVTDSTLAHVAGDRALSLYGRACARGSRDALGIMSSYSTVSLRRTDTHSWPLVSTC